MELGVTDETVEPPHTDTASIADELSDSPRSAGLELQVTDDCAVGLSDHNVDFLCEKCGQFLACSCNADQRVQISEDSIPATSSHRPTARQHSRTGVRLTRKRTRNVSQWKSTKRRKLRQSGQPYMMTSGNMAAGKVVQPCKREHYCCRFKCAQHFDTNAQEAIHHEHWSLVDDDKRHFYLNTTSCQTKSRSRRAQNVNKKKLSYSYFFISSRGKIRVCKDFYLSTLNIDAKRIRNVHVSRNPVTGTPASYKRGRHVKKTCASFRDTIRRHIESIPVVESHYCRRDTNKVYLSGQLNLRILYEKYLEYCHERGEATAKEHLYRQIFNQEYNISFLKRKTDRCDICELSKMCREERSTKYQEHITGKEETHVERKSDRECNDKCVVCFDLQNVFALPLANVSNFFYKRKLNVYHLTAHCSITKQCYGVLWTEALSGRTGNDIASGLVRMLENIIKDNPSITEMTLWSDSCIPQNRNRVMTSALMLFMQQNPSVTLLTEKFCEPGHSEIQEIDNLHSQIEKAVQHCEIYSPLGLARVLLKTPRHKPIKITQMRKNDIRDYMTEANHFKFDSIPFSKVKAIQYSKGHTHCTVSYKTSFADENWIACNLTVQRRSMARGQLQSTVIPAPKRMSEAKTTLSAEKIKDLKSMLDYMPEPDRDYMKTLLKNTSTVQNPNVEQVDDHDKAALELSVPVHQKTGSSVKRPKPKVSPANEPSRNPRTKPSQHQESAVSCQKTKTKRRITQRQEAGPSVKVAKPKESPATEPSKNARKKSSRHSISVSRKQNNRKKNVMV